MKRKLFGIALMSMLVACGTNTAEQGIDEVQSEGKVSQIIRNPVSADNPLDTINVAKLDFEVSTHEFGEVTEGDIVAFTYKFTNNGKVPLLISNAKSTCGCTVPEWPKDPVAPGASGEIAVKFDTKNKRDRQSKPITITANTYPSQTKIFLKGTVLKAPTSEQ